MTHPESQDLLVQLSEAMAGAVEKAAASVVTVAARRRIPASGIAWGGDVVVTADHVIEEDEIHVGLPDGSVRPAELAGRDAASGIAVLRVPGGGLTPAVRRGEPVRAGAFVLAVARPGEAGPVVSSGVVSAIGGPWRGPRGGHLDGYLRTDAAFYPGFSGGALVDAAGAVVGMNSSFGGRGLPLTIPVAPLARVADLLLSRGRVSRGYLGVGSQPAQLPAALAAKLGRGQETGLLIVGVEAGSPAEAAGLMMGDILVEVEGAPLEDTGDLQAALGPQTVGRPTRVRILRGGEPAELSVTPGERE